MSVRAEAVVGLDAIGSNLARVRELAGGAEVMAVVKADAYGHGMLRVSRFLRSRGVTWLGVALLDRTTHPVMLTEVG